MTDQQFQRHALFILGRDVGAEGLARSLRLCRSNSDYTRDHYKLIGNQSIPDVVRQIRACESSCYLKIGS